MKVKIIDHLEFKKRSARAKWYAAVNRYDGKDLEAFVAATTKKLPILNKHGDGEAPQGWIRFFEREEIIELKD